MSEPSDPPARQAPDDPPPFLKTWPRVYIAVIIYLVLLILALYLFMRIFTP